MERNRDAGRTSLQALCSPCIHISRRRWLRSSRSDCSSAPAFGPRFEWVIRKEESDGEISVTSVLHCRGSQGVVEGRRFEAAGGGENAGREPGGKNRLLLFRVWQDRRRDRRRLSR